MDAYSACANAAVGDAATEVQGIIAARSAEGYADIERNPNFIRVTFGIWRRKDTVLVFTSCSPWQTPFCAAPWTPSTTIAGANSRLVWMMNKSMRYDLQEHIL